MVFSCFVVAHAVNYIKNIIKIIFLLAHAVNSWNCYDLLHRCYELFLLARAGFSGACYELNGSVMNYDTLGM